MAQALFDEHPIEVYLRESGEVPELMPGGLDEFTREASHGSVPYQLDALQIWLHRLFNTVQLMFEPFLTGFRVSSASSEFAERFKYIVISSPLLSSSLSSSPVTATPTTPGHFDQSNPILPILSPSSSAVSPTVTSLGSHIPTYTLACLVPLALTWGHYLACIPLLAAMKYLSDGSLHFPISHGFSSREEPWTLTLDCLAGLIAANNTWETVVSEAFGILETEEQSASPSSLSSSPLHPLRMALSSSLHTTEMQCDNIRQLLSALTSPIVLSQLSHMYAPPPPSRMSPSPKRSRPMSLAPPSPEHFRTTPQVPPLSLSNPPDDAYTRSRAGLAPQTSLADKRSTWSGAYYSLHEPSRRLRGRLSSRSAVFRVEELDSPKTPTFSVSSHSSHVLRPPAATEDVANAADAEDEPFGVAALDLHRRRRGSTRAPLLNPSSSSSNTAHLSPTDTASQFHSPQGPLLISSLGSNFTALSSPPTSRQAHYLSLSNLHLALQGALGSKRFACAHLLALRFSHISNPQSQGSDVDSENESYWEDVRSIISLFTSTLEGASARLAEALVDRVRRQEQESDIITEDGSSNLASPASSHVPTEFNNSNEPLSFAPMPSHLARFAAYIDAISSALDDARDHLRQCVASLKEDVEVVSSVAEDSKSPVALQSYERLRRELGLALRECERGRGTLLQIVQRTTPDHLAEEDDEESPVRQEGHFSSGESDKTMYNSHEVHDPRHTYVDQKQNHNPNVHDDDDDDDATSHLILTATSQHLPPPGIEQVFETVSASHPFVRERSKLTREERIRIAKARREGQFCPPRSSVAGSHEGEPHSVREKWGPGGEVVQELKDVIWQVSEQRRKMIERSSLAPHSDALYSPT